MFFNLVGVLNYEPNTSVNHLNILMMIVGVLCCVWALVYITVIQFSISVWNKQAIAEQQDVSYHAESGNNQIDHLTNNSVSCSTTNQTSNASTQIAYNFNEAGLISSCNNIETASQVSDPPPEYDPPPPYQFKTSNSQNEMNVNQ